MEIKAQLKHQSSTRDEEWGRVPLAEDFSNTIVGWQRRNARLFPWRSSRDPYEVLVGEILLQRTRAENVVDVYEQFIRRWPTAGHLARAREATITRVIEPLGLRRRSAILGRLGRELNEYGKVPLEPSALQELPGVGRYAAHAVPIFARNRQLPLVDWVIARVLRRFFGLPPDKRPNADEELWSLALVLIEYVRARDLWLGVLDFGAAICRPRPLCPVCPLLLTCEWAKSSDLVGARR
jgi:A/G-specific adenine glycosylase